MGKNFTISIKYHLHDMLANKEGPSFHPPPLRFKRDFKLSRQKQIPVSSWLLTKTGWVLIGIKCSKLKENKTCHKHACTANYNSVGCAKMLPS